MSSSFAARLHSFRKSWLRLLVFPPTFWLAVAAPSAFAVMMTKGPLGILREGKDTSINWDIFLAWLPIGPALLAHWLSVHRGPSANRRGPAILVWFTLLVWLLFFPNSPYLLTQFVHLQTEYPVSKHIPWDEWYEYMKITATAVAGLLLTLTSLRIVELTASVRVGRLAAALMVTIVIGLASFGVALGRFARLNSWDPFSNPYYTVQQILYHAGDKGYQRTTAVFAMLLLSVYVAVRQMATRTPRPATPRDES